MGIWNRFFYGEPTVLERSEETPLPSDPSPVITAPTFVASPTSVNMGEALGLSSVFRAISIYAVAVQQMSVKVFTNDLEVRAPLWVRQPDVNESAPAFWEMTVTSLALDGNAYWYIERDNQGRMKNLEVLNPLDVTIETNQRGRVVKYNYMGVAYNPADIKHLKLSRIPGKPKGLGPIQANQAGIRGAIDTRDYGSSFFRDSGVPNGLLKSEFDLTAEDAAKAKSAWNDTAGAKNGVAVLGQGFNYVSTYIKPSDAQFLEVQQFNVTDIARLFGIPSSLMLAAVDGTSMTYSNLEQEWVSFIRFTLMKYIREIEQALTDLLPRGTEARFNVDSLLRTDTKSRYEAHAIAIDKGFMSVEEVRAIEKLPPLGEVAPVDTGVTNA